MGTRSLLKGLTDYGASKTRLEIPVREGMVLVLLDNAKTRFAAVGGPAGNDADEVFVAELDDIYLGRGVIYVRYL